MLRTLLFLSSLIFVFSACTKKEHVTEINHINEVFADNIPPPYDGITTVEINNYVNKIYIDLYGREPLEVELDAATQELKDGGLLPETREILLDNLLASSEFFDRLWEIYSSQYLANVTHEYLDFQIILYNQAYMDAMQAGNLALAQRIQIEINHLEDLRNAKDDYASADIDISEFMTRIAHNAIYDEINMGSENFVISCFENFFKRYPTEAELPAGVSMVDGFSSQILLQDGNNKSDFLDILFGNGEFFQGLIIDIYALLLARLPDSQEMGEATLIITDSGNFQACQRSVMVTDEYAGF